MGKRLEVFTVVDRGKDREGNEQSAIWLRVGSAFYNQDNSINVYLDAHPVNGRLNIREPRAPKQGTEDGTSHSNRQQGTPPGGWNGEQPRTPRQDPPQDGGKAGGADPWE